jgi:hypothetical protein
MSAGQTPSGSDQFPWFKVGGMVGGAAVGANTVHHNQAKSRHDRLLREQQRGESLKRGDLTAKQYVLYSARDGRSAREIKETLDACGGIHEGHDYSNPDSFDVEEVHVPSSDPIKWATDFTDQSCRLKRYPSNKGKKKWFGLRGGYTPPTEPQILSEDGPEMAAEEYQYSPNMSYEISEEYSQGRPVIDSFIARRPYVTPPAVYYVVAIGLALAGSLLFDYVKDYVKRKLTGSKDSQQSSSELDENGSGRPQGEGQELKACTSSTQLMRPQSMVKPEFLLETFTSYKRGTITKGAATRILMVYYNLSEEEALDWLDKK